MVSTLTWVLAGIILYTVIAMALRSRGVLPESVRLQGPITTIHTKRGRALLNRLAAPKRFWRAWGNFGVGIALVVMVGSFVGVLFAGIRSITSPTSTPVRNPQNVLVIPGVNEFLPLSAAPEIVFGLVAGLVVHEGGHGLLCRVEDIEIDSMGVALLAFIPIGAFVQPDEESRNRANRGAQTRMFAAGVTNNFAITLIAFLLLFGPVIGSISVAAGVPVGRSLPGSPAESAGLAGGDRITAVAGTPVDNESDVERVLDGVAGSSVTVTVNGERRLLVNRSLMMTRAVSAVISGTDRADGDGITWRSQDPPIITAVNGTAVATEAEFRGAVADRPVVRVRTDKGTATFPAGALVSRAQEDGPFVAAGAPNDRSLVVTAVDGQRVADFAGLREVLSGHEPGDTVSVTAYVIRDGSFERQVYEGVELAEDPDGEGAFLGVFLQPGVSGLSVDDFGIDTYPAAGFLGLLGGGEGPLGGLTDRSFVRQVVVVLLMPFISAIEPSIAYNFAGFVPEVANFYTVEGPLSVLGGFTFTLANALFWTGWINLQLGLFNCIPSFPLDGGHILRTSTEAVVSRLPLPERRRLTTTLTIAISLTMIAALFLMVFGPQLFAG